MQSARRARLDAALKVAKRTDRSTLEDLAAVWGTSKSRFVSTRNMMEGEGIVFPPHTRDAGQTYVYPTIAALKAMIKYVERHDAREAHRYERRKAIIGKPVADDADRGFSLTELSLLRRESAAVQEQARDQSELLERQDTAHVAGEVFSYLSSNLSEFSAHVDPNGEFDAKTAERADELGRIWLRTVHKKMREILEPDAHAARSQHPKPGRARGSARRSRAA